MTRQQRRLFQDKEHLVRMAGIFAAGTMLFLVLQLALVPESFGRYGHYRANAIDEEARKPITYAGRNACTSCHSAQVEVHKSGKHAGLGCEGCHGPLFAHTRKPVAAKASKPDVKRLCIRCHEKNVARPSWFAQVDSAEHSGGEVCTTCHQPHAPQMGGDA